LILDRPHETESRLRPTQDQVECLGERDLEILRRASAVIGVDEVGRGSIAGPVVVCAALFDRIPSNPAVRDSKRLTARQRRETSWWIRENAVSWVISEVWPELIDRVNILGATRLAMRASVRALASPGCEAVVDHVELGELGLPVHTFKRADGSFFSVAAASILAKVHRDRVMTELGDLDGRWGWSHNMGYGTMEHRRGVGRYGRSYLHRRSFRLSPVLS
jgi:ribonuclease HII